MYAKDRLPRPPPVRYLCRSKAFALLADLM